MKTKLPYRARLQDVAKTNMDTAREASEKMTQERGRLGKRHGRLQKGVIISFACALSTWKYHNGDRRASEWSFMQPPRMDGWHTRTCACAFVCMAPATAAFSPTGASNRFIGHPVRGI